MLIGIAIVFLIIGVTSVFIKLLGKRRTKPTIMQIILLLGLVILILAAIYITFIVLDIHY
ncbi:hypothetical protein LBSG162_01040 [Lentilactobacillus buchneri subsp. silagei]|nr:hypothetical protein [Lentilactobacillus buchneri]BEJ52564.1 hypothetical protein Ltb232_07400 [Lentilactobacillus buchneri subsp. silagei]MCT3542685.1 hypothetical protein [Lentilactobacillus buchneri]MCT3545826.1 hypothetical protein [Lentilactobacillus buchneri]MCT3552794.1 hypothetical protein [Lentilactobacillus buchneri]